MKLNYGTTLKGPATVPCGKSVRTLSPNQLVVLLRNRNKKITFIRVIKLVLRNVYIFYYQKQYLELPFTVLYTALSTINLLTFYRNIHDTPEALSLSASVRTPLQVLRVSNAFYNRGAAPQAKFLNEMR